MNNFVKKLEIAQGVASNSSKCSTIPPNMNHHIQKISS